MKSRKEKEEEKKPFSFRTKIKYLLDRIIDRSQSFSSYNSKLCMAKKGEKNEKRK